MWPADGRCGRWRRCAYFCVFLRRHIVWVLPVWISAYLKCYSDPYRIRTFWLFRRMSVICVLWISHMTNFIATENKLSNLLVGGSSVLLGGDVRSASDRRVAWLAYRITCVANKTFTFGQRWSSFSFSHALLKEKHAVFKKKKKNKHVRVGLRYIFRQILMARILRHGQHVFGCCNALPHTAKMKRGLASLSFSLCSAHSAASNRVRIAKRTLNVAAKPVWFREPHRADELNWNADVGGAQFSFIASGSAGRTSLRTHDDYYVYGNRCATMMLRKTSSPGDMNRMFTVPFCTSHVVL